VLEPPQRATVSIVFLRGYTDAPFILLDIFPLGPVRGGRPLCVGAGAVPLAPVYAGRPPADVTAAVDFAWYDAAVANATMPALVNAPGTAATEAVLRADAVAVDRLGLFLSIHRVEAVVARERAACGAAEHPAAGGCSSSVIASGRP